MKASYISIFLKVSLLLKLRGEILSTPRKRKAIPAEEKGRRTTSTKVITAGDLASSGKKSPASVGSGIKEPMGKKEVVEEDNDEEEKSVAKSIFVPLIKANAEEQTVTGVVLQPEVVDAQGDIMSAEVIRKAAHSFLSKYNKATQLGFMHKVFGKYKFDLYQSWIAPQDVVISGTTIKAGSWIMTVHVGDKKIWKLVKTAKIKGFSIGGKAKAKKISDKAS
jgi:hypothetical protein